MTSLAFISVVSFLTVGCIGSFANAAQLKGIVELGGTSHTCPQGKVKVTLYEATSKKPRVIGQVAPGVFRRGGISKFAGVNLATRPPKKKAGDPLSPKTGYTVQSAGSQVLLHDGTPLNGERGLPSFEPLMRSTSLQIDQAGSIWTINNWKPRFSTNVLGFNEGEISPDDAKPGGDGLIIFVGLAPPPRPKSN